MDQNFVNEMLDKLIKAKDEILQFLLAENSDFQAMVKEKDMDPKDLADIAADDIDRNTLDALGVAEVRRLRLIDSAISRIKNDRYGICVRCNKLIPTERLKAIPYALMCVPCQTEEERKNR
ncbi:MAG: TraR/DksA family transcriptional regulator [Spirochaetales bacterium]|jgi:RNA polymerase-binding transcription factor DksA|nr:TraR/DksA family transcriptional regulator [Spirochaetales bacterium]